MSDPLDALPCRRLHERALDFAAELVSRYTRRDVNVVVGRLKQAWTEGRISERTFKHYYLGIRLAERGELWP